LTHKQEEKTCEFDQNASGCSLQKRLKAPAVQQRQGFVLTVV